MKVELLHFENCPHTQPALELLQDVLREAGVETRIDSIAVETADEAQQYRFPGSPTIRVDGRDVAGEAPGEYGLGCRVYVVEGKVLHWPPRHWIEEAVRKWRHPR